MKKFLTIAVLALFSQISLANSEGDGGLGTPEPYNPGNGNKGNVWFHCGNINGMGATVLNDLTFVLTETNGVEHRYPMSSTGGFFEKTYMTSDGQFILRAQLSNPHVTDRAGNLLGHCSN